MHPSFSVIFFTTASGGGYGLLALLGVLVPLGMVPRSTLFAFVALGLALGLITAGLLSSTFHLGRPERALRAFSQWRSSWLSREGVASVATYIPAGLFAALWLISGIVSPLLGFLAAACAVVTVVCTAMIYRSLKPIQRWHNGWVVPNYLAFALMTGALWLEFLLQSAWPDIKVHVSSLTDEWAGMAVSGPKAREALKLAFRGTDLSDAKLPYMGCLEIEFEGVPVRFIRLSFSGELAYEVYAPADHGVALWERILSRAAPLGIKPYGLEALASLRIEKGHVAGLELDHRNTLDDLGLAKMAAKEKPYIGRALRQRPLMQAPGRWSLVGIECLELGKKLRGGSILFAAADKIEGHGRGYITSVTWSIELDKFIALGLFQGGLKHVGEEIVCAYPLKGEQVRARIVSPHFIDPKGERLNA